MNNFFAIMDLSGKAKPTLFAMIVRDDKPADSIEAFVDGQQAKFDTSMLDRIAAEYPDSVRGLTAFAGQGQREGTGEFVVFKEVDISGWKLCQTGPAHVASNQAKSTVKQMQPVAP